MLHFISGGTRSGKSEYGEQLACLLAKSRKIYIATAAVQDMEMQTRVLAHQSRRAPLSFLTIEQPFCLADSLPMLKSCDVVLIDSLSIYLSNIFFQNPQQLPAEADVIRRISGEVRLLVQTVRHVIIVSDDIFFDSFSYDAYTQRYLSALGHLHQELAGIADCVAECTASVVQIWKRSKLVRGEKAMIFIIGGAYSGKAAYAQTLSAGKVCDLKTQQPDGDILLNMHALVFQLLKNGQDPSSYIESLLPNLKDKIITACEVGCGVVPIDPFERKYRDEAGKVNQLLAQHADKVIRMYCGIPCILKDK